MAGFNLRFLPRRNRFVINGKDSVKMHPLVSAQPHALRFIARPEIRHGLRRR
jgi:hypothetical protein